MLTCAAAVVAGVAADSADVVVAGSVGAAAGTGHTDGAAPPPRRGPTESPLLLGICKKTVKTRDCEC